MSECPNCTDGTQIRERSTLMTIDTAPSLHIFDGSTPRFALPKATTDIIRRALGLPVTLEEQIVARTEDAQRRGELAFLDDELPLFVDEMMLPYFPRAR